MTKSVSLKYYKKDWRYHIKSWKQFQFIITPAEMESTLEGLHHVVFNARVEANYKESDSQFFFKNYKKFYDKLMSGYIFNYEVDYEYLNLYMGFTDDLSKCIFGEPFKDTNDNLLYKISKFREPCVTISPFAMQICSDNKLYTKLSCFSGSEFIIGTELQFPKTLIYSPPPHTKSTKSSEIVPCTDMENNKVYELISKRIKSITKNWRFETNEKAFRSAVRISKKAREDIKNSYFVDHFNVKL